MARWLVTFCYHGNKTKNTDWLPVPDGKHRRLPHGLVPRMSEKTFDDFIVDALQGNMPGTYMYTRPRNVANKGALQNCFSDRARDGFRYWLIERPKPTNCEYTVFIICLAVTYVHTIKGIIEPVHEISNNVVCATSKASDQPAHTRSLIRAFACCLNIL